MTAETTSDFVATITRNAEFESDDQVREVATATLRAFGECLSEGEALTLADALPEEFAAPLREGGAGTAESRPLEEFFAEVHEATGVDETVLRSMCPAVLFAVREAAGADELDDARAQLPSDYDVLFDLTSAGLEADSFADALKAETDIADEETAERVSRAVLETLGVRIATGEAEDIAGYLPDPAADWLVRPESPEADSFEHEEFVSRVAGEADVDEDEAYDYIEAAGSVLEEAVAEPELARAGVQLDPDYDRLFDFVVERT